MLTPQEEIGKISQERLARESQAARFAKAAGNGKPGLAQRAMLSAGESFVSLGNWMKKVSQAGPTIDLFDIRYNQ